MAERKYHVVTLGCQMNKSDSERAATLLERLGFSPADRPEEADFILMNSCSVRQAAEDRIFGLAERFARLRASNPRLLVAVTGCMAGRDRDGVLRKKLPQVDFFFPTRDLPQLPRWLAEHDPEIAAGGDLTADYLNIRPKYSCPFSAYVPIQTGCNKFCTYCVVPYARGLEKNRSAADILAEIRALAEKGTLEITLAGQAVNAYRAPDPENFSKDNPYKDHFAALMWEVNRVAGVERVHYTAPHPLHMTDEVIDALALPKQVNYLHLPVQSGDDGVLKRMNRRYGRDFYLDLIGKIKAKRPGIALGTDIIVGFCGETEAQFENTLDIYRRADFDIAYTAQYSTRSGTAAAKFLKDDVPREEKKRRWNVLQALMEETALRKNEAYVGRTVRVLVDSCRLKRGVQVCSGNSDEMKTTEFPGEPNLAGRLVEVKINEAYEWLLKGEAA